MAYGLTKSQHEVLKFIETFIDEQGYAPSYQEICTAVGFKSRSNAHRLVHALEQRGYLILLRDRARSISLVSTSADWGMHL